MSTATNDREPLSRDRIVETALAIVDAEGLDALSMRRLGAELRVNPMAAYYHIPNKAALLDAVVEAVMAEIDLGVDDPSRPPEERLVTAAMEYARVLFLHANTLPVLLSRGPATLAALAPVELMVGIFRDAGLSIERAMIGMNVVAAAVRGYVAMMAAAVTDAEHASSAELAKLISPEAFPHLSEAATLPQTDPQQQFEHGLRAVAIGLLGK